MSSSVLVLFRQAREEGRSLQNDVDRLQEELLRAQRAVKSAETLQVRVPPYSKFCRVPTSPLENTEDTQADKISHAARVYVPA